MSLLKEIISCPDISGIRDAHLDIENEANEISTNTSSLYLDDSTIDVFPNPANSYINFQSKIEEEIDRIEIFDTRGVLIANGNIQNSNSERVDISQFGSWMYFYKVYTNQGKFVSGKFIKQ